MWKSLSFFALVQNNPLGIKTSTTPDSNQTITFDTAPKCESGTYYKNNYGSSGGGVGSDGAPVGGTTSVWVKRKSVRVVILYI